MPAIVTSKLRLENAKRIFRNIQTNREVYYFFVAKPTDWDDENSPDFPLDTENVSTSVFSDLLTLKRILSTDVQLGIRRYNWESNSYYQKYDDSIDLGDYNSSSFKPYYVITNDLKVYKCLWNNSVRETKTPIKITVDGSSGSVVSSVNDEITSNAHGFVNGDKVKYSATSGTEIDGLISGNSYYIVNKTNDTFQLSETFGGVAIDILGVGAGTSHTFIQESFGLSLFTYTPGSGEMVVYVNGKRLEETSFAQYSSTRVVIDSGLVNENDTIIFEKIGPSTIKPTSSATDTSGQTETLADGYRWKYMFTVSSPNAFKFLTKNWIPVEDINYDDSSDQWDIQENAVSGIDTVNVLENGSGYHTRITEGTVQSGSTSTTIVLENSASATDDYYNGMSVYIVSGTGAGQLRVISDYTGSTRTATVAAWTTTPDITSNYEVCPTLNVSSNTGTGMVARIPYGGIDLTTGAILETRVVSIGSGYQDATVVVSSTPAVGSGATFKAVLPPKNGHGSYAQAELGASSIIVAAELDGSESGSIIAYNEFRKTGLIKNPVLFTGPIMGATGVNQSQIILGVGGATGPSTSNDVYNGQLLTIISGPGRNQTKLITDYVGASKTATVEYARTDITYENVWDVVPTTSSSYGIIANGNLYNQTLELTYSGAISGTFVDDEVVTQEDSGAFGNIVYVDTSNSKIYLININGTFVENKTITGNSASALISAVGKQPIVAGEGEIVLIEHRKKVTRSSDQKEDFKLILEF